MIIIKPISDLDEIWNYNTARAISEGLVPYKDISMITTPLLPMITAIFLKTIANVPSLFEKFKIVIIFQSTLFKDSVILILFRVLFTAKFTISANIIVIIIPYIKHILLIS